MNGLIKTMWLKDIRGSTSIVILVLHDFNFISVPTPPNPEQLQSSWVTTMSPHFNQVFRQWFTDLPCSICIVPWVLFGTYSESSLMCSHHASCRYLESPLCHHFHYLSLMSSHYLYFYHQHRRNLNELPCPLGNILSVWRSNRQVLLVNK